jgi:hypothetical protein
LEGAAVLAFLVGCGAATPSTDARTRTEPMLGPFQSLDARCETLDDPRDEHADPVAPWVGDDDACPGARDDETATAAEQGVIVRAGVVRDEDGRRVFVELVSGRAWVAATATTCDGGFSAEIGDGGVTVRLGASVSSCRRDGPEWRCTPWAPR